MNKLGSDSNKINPLNSQTIVIERKSFDFREEYEGNIRVV